MLLLFLSLVPSGYCPLAAEDTDEIVVCPGWKERVCRERNEDGTLRRSKAVKREFLKRYGIADGARRGWVLDHLYPLSCGGCDVPWNLQLQTVADGKAKDRWERDVCATVDVPTYGAKTLTAGNQ